MTQTPKRGKHRADDSDSTVLPPDAAARDAAKRDEAGPQDQALTGDGFVFGSPVHYAAASGTMTSFMDRVFFSSFCAGRKPFRLKPGAVVVSARRAGTTAALDQLN